MFTSKLANWQYALFAVAAILLLAFAMVRSTGSFRAEGGWSQPYAVDAEQPLRFDRSFLLGPVD